ncbi:RNA polymerase sigma-70 factor [Solitalea canadensis]|uniref:RNA polymerase sigma-70 factor, Bacteroides expansion family 1 n=1 Tax=Solitalea canadensis (strain ATCC 29591 / DSM 3403 / JCM 21819 / LMG 8368 / NBRC 15130 / NCIMB 12057 / USAM 9D) TaxID=929556 RepID=H8KWF4_SOLCM|nr:RNA polymerase sigma-70 factor [Solitalea canadensis]AFD08072.1 RNA polymerase sigma-70 factor, Bacteroides expansion family 1 [Solitalea canadensis DSM 3403]
MTSDNENGALSDEQIAERLLERDHSVFTSLYRNYFQNLLMLAHKYVKDQLQAEEIIQDVFLRLWESPIALENPAAMRSYLYRAVINQSINHINKQKNISKHHSIIAEQLTEEYIDTLHEENELKLLIHREIELLPEQCKKVFKMSRFDHMKYREIAQELNIAEKTVENHIKNALKTLRERLFIDTENGNKHYSVRLKMSIAFLLLCEKTRN